MTSLGATPQGSCDAKTPSGESAISSRRDRSTTLTPLTLPCVCPPGTVHVMSVMSRMRHRFVGAAYLLPIAFVFYTFCFWGYGIIDQEAMGFVLNYLQKRSILAAIFDPNMNDFGLYQARELSYLFDFIDARVFATLLDRHILLFVPMSGVIGLVALSAIYVWGARKVIGLDHVTTSLALSLFLSCIVVQASTAIFYRSSKIALSVALIGLLFWLVSLIRDQDAERPAKLMKLALLFFLGMLMSLCDRQGFYYLITATIIVAMLWLARMARGAQRWPNPFRIILTLLAAIIAAILYNQVIAPLIIHSLNGYWPSFDYQHLTRAQLFDPALPAEAWDMFQAQVSLFFGNLPFAAACLIGAIVLLPSMRRSAPRSRTGGGFLRVLLDDIPIATLASAAALTGLLFVMIARHPPVYSIPDHSYWYYTFSIHVIILFGITTWFGLLGSRSHPRWRPALWLVLLILIGLNVEHYRQQRQIMINSEQWFKNQYDHSKFFVAQFAAMQARSKGSPDQAQLDLDQITLREDDVYFLQAVRMQYATLRQRP